jgi:hypothetical protein
MNVYEDKINRASVIITEHFTSVHKSSGLDKNEAVPGSHNQIWVNVADATAAIDLGGFTQKLTAMGGTSDEALRECRWEDLEACGLPRLLAKRVADIFRGKPESETAREYISERRVSAMTNEELIGRYNPEEPDSTVGKRLNTLSKGLRFLVYGTGGNIDAEASAKLLSEITKGYGERPGGVLLLSGVPCRIYKVGEQPTHIGIVDENPFYPGRPLRPDGTCDQTGRSWEGVPLIVRQLVRLIHDAIPYSSVEAAHDLMDMAVLPDAKQKLVTRYPAIAVKAQELDATGKLPSLKVHLKSGSKKADPFATA